jgi:hypothetical protein
VHSTGVVVVVTGVSRRGSIPLVVVTVITVVASVTSGASVVPVAPLAGDRSLVVAGPVEQAASNARAARATASRRGRMPRVKPPSVRIRREHDENRVRAPLDSGSVRSAA